MVYVKVLSQDRNESESHSFTCVSMCWKFYFFYLRSISFGIWLYNLVQHDFYFHLPWSCMVISGLPIHFHQVCIILHVKKVIHNKIRTCTFVLTANVHSYEWKSIVMRYESIYSFVTYCALITQEHAQPFYMKRHTHVV